jgi:hypothetical protein
LVVAADEDLAAAPSRRGVDVALAQADVAAEQAHRAAAPRSAAVASTLPAADEAPSPASTVTCRRCCRRR